jgi:hypothetical protein
MYSSRLFQDLENWTKALIGIQHLLSYAVKLVDYSQKKLLYVNKKLIFQKKIWYFFIFI